MASGAAGGAPRGTGTARWRAVKSKAEGVGGEGRGITGLPGRLVNRLVITRRKTHFRNLFHLTRTLMSAKRRRKAARRNAALHTRLQAARAKIGRFLGTEGKARRDGATPMRFECRPCRQPATPRHAAPRQYTCSSRLDLVAGYRAVILAAVRCHACCPGCGRDAETVFMSPPPSVCACAALSPMASMRMMARQDGAAATSSRCGRRHCPLGG